MFVVGKSANVEITKLPLFSNTFSITNDKGTFEEDSSCDVNLKGILLLRHRLQL